MHAKNAVQFLHAAMKNRPNEQRIPVPKHFVKQLMKRLEADATEIFLGETNLRELRRTSAGALAEKTKEIDNAVGQITALKAEIEQFKTELSDADARIAALQDALEAKPAA